MRGSPPAPFRLPPVSLAPLLFASSLALVAPDHHEEKPLEAPPQVGQTAPDFELPALIGDEAEGNGGDPALVKLSEVAKTGPVVLMVLRGYPGYQCPICSRQVAGFVRRADALEKAGARVLMVYPGPKADLGKFAAEFAGKFDLPENFLFLLDPDYKFTNAYKLRWDAPRETAYPSTFVLTKGRKVALAKVSEGHGDRSEPKEVLAAVRKAAKM